MQRIVLNQLLFIGCILILYHIPVLPLFPLDEKYAYERKQKLLPQSEKDALSPVEDLMQEHGILDRLLLIYEETIKRIDNKDPFHLSIVIQATQIIQSFIEKYHEKLEEEYIFPLFIAHRKDVRLVRALNRQHQKGREITAQILALTTGKKTVDQKVKRMLKELMQKYISLYRPHMAREETQLFPNLRSIITHKEFDQLAKKCEKKEEQILGKNGFARIVQKIAHLEKQLGIYSLE